MNKKNWWIVGVVIVVVLIAAWFFMMKPGAPGSYGNNVQSSGSGAPMSMKELLTNGKSQKCTFKTSGPDTQSSGVIYVTAGHMRGDFSSVANGKTMASHMVTDGTTSYVWTDQMAQGMKMSFSSTNSAQQSASPSESQSVSPDQQLNYDCSGWSPDQSEFTLPAGVTFSDMSAMMNAGAAAGASAGAGSGAGASGGAASNAAICAQCNSITSAQGKAACLSAYSCK